MDIQYRENLYLELGFSEEKICHLNTVILKMVKLSVIISLTFGNKFYIENTD